MKEFKIAHLVKSEDLNIHGTLFAARAAAWFVESGYIAASSTHGSTAEVVCVNVHGMVFSKPVKNGDIISFNSKIVRAGRTSLTSAVEVVSELTGETTLKGFATFVTIDHKTGRSMEHNIQLDETTDEKELQLRKEASKLFEK
ncbi:MAG: acyl-CoA thioesterase [Anaerovoracaceae bacterium]|jgi:acyl-CoA hydrolase